MTEGRYSVRPEPIAAVELHRQAREAEALGDFEAATRLRETLSPEPAMVPVVAHIDVRELLDADLEALSEAIAAEMIRRSQDDDPQAMTVR